jgi:hypothetical protein
MFNGIVPGICAHPLCVRSGSEARASVAQRTAIAVSRCNITTMTDNRHDATQLWHTASTKNAVIFAFIRLLAPFLIGSLNLRKKA